MQDPRKGKAAGVFVLGGVVTLTSQTPPLLILGRYKDRPSTTSQAHSTTMNPLLILAFVGAAGEFHALPQASPTPFPGRHMPCHSCHLSSFDYALIFYFLHLAALLPILLGLFLSLTCFTFSLISLPPLSFFHTQAMVGEAGKGGQMGLAHKMKQQASDLAPAAPK